MRETKQSKAKKLAVKNYEEQKELLTQQGYTEENATMSVQKIYLMMLVVPAPIIFIFWNIYAYVWNVKWGAIPFQILTAHLISVPVHEFLHGLGWSLFCKNGFKSIRFGMIWEHLMPYCNCKEPLKFHQYLIGTLLPLTMLGLLPSIIGIIFGNYNIFLFGILGIIAAGGDMAICLGINKYKKALFLDHPTECGYIAFLLP